MKKILIGCGVVSVLCVCCLVIGLFGFNAVLSSGLNEKNRVIEDLCLQTQDYSDEDFSELFTSDFQNETGADEAYNYALEMFGDNTNCKEYSASNIIELFTKGQSINVANTNGLETIDFQLTINGNRFTFQLVKEDDGVYRIQYINNI